MKKVILVIYLILGNVYSQVTILPLGNSITNGYPDSYRYSLWKMLVENECLVDFVGTRNFHGRPAGVDSVMGLPFDAYHEGMPGRTTGETLAVLDTIMQHVGPVDIALIHLGTNDVFTNVPLSVVGMRMDSIVELLQAANPGIRIVLAQIIPVLSSPVDNDSIEALNILYADISDLSPGVWLVDMYTNFEDSANYHLPNQIHPSQAGADIMADRFYGVVKGLVDCD